MPMQFVFFILFSSKTKLFTQQQAVAFDTQLKMQLWYAHASHPLIDVRFGRLSRVDYAESAINVNAHHECGFISHRS